MKADLENNPDIWFPGWKKSTIEEGKRVTQKLLSKPDILL